MAPKTKRKKNAEAPFQKRSRKRIASDESSDESDNKSRLSWSRKETCAFVEHKAKEARTPTQEKTVSAEPVEPGALVEAGWRGSSKDQALSQALASPPSAETPDKREHYASVAPRKPMVTAKIMNKRRYIKISFT